MSKVDINVKINGKTYKDKVSPQLMLADYLQEICGLSGTKVCCAVGSCKACTVAVKPKDGKMMKMQACITPLSAVNGQELTTVEGLGKEGKLHKLQEAFLKHFSFQCGYSSPGFLMGALVLMDKLKSKPIAKSQLDQEIQNSLGEHVCRCTGYVRYHRAIKEVILSEPGLTT
ncbi:(2Fe-2S)-binding protein [Pseudobacteriovorax antillogorgiicola]|uniref:Aerobic-type carbon monoxide dehydrogenase, small subunit, CoxS/CutS family n=1 Tax=Pseudobacteriovorax antillogorgiicola TaxID=1513793 RepID=A0A1Y6C8U5_9BACT|nr:2Fe-2S iron-sulfur cluster-binding protein [Pseudobacteriovorax antillogorgiicola]TCS49790.1 aerobic-type carbon monoxide dehydrogenase small subunit (CoxS/CutS family) [Pseudobacteriovorax antillogorgiicola]SMF42944.1 Aerobic-type carbon monoxide dehydrogenase, small subunit, CoxS/CutS family [Pseudobacteriovorax antillogorgiicola]